MPLPVEPPSRCTLPFRRLHVYLSFTNRGDTVVTFSAESDGVIESALHFGRRVEAFVATADAKEDVASRVEDAWESSWRDGHFSVSTASCFLVSSLHSQSGISLAFRSAHDVQALQESSCVAFVCGSWPLA